MFRPAGDIQPLRSQQHVEGMVAVVDHRVAHGLVQRVRSFVVFDILDCVVVVHSFELLSSCELRDHLETTKV